MTVTRRISRFASVVQRGQMLEGCHVRINGVRYYWLVDQTSDTSLTARCACMIAESVFDLAPASELAIAMRP